MSSDFDTRARVKWLRKLLDHTCARLHYAQDVRGHNAVREQTEDAVDALYIAARIASPPLAKKLLKLSGRLQLALRYLGHPSDDELYAVAQEVAEIRSDLQPREGVVE